MDVLLPTSPTIFTVAVVLADPVRLNSLLGHYTNFVNLLDYAAIAVPASFRQNGLPVGVTLIGAAFSDHDLARLGARLHGKAACGSGLVRHVMPPDCEPIIPEPAGMVTLAVADAHLSGMPLNGQLLKMGGRLLTTTRTVPNYRLMALNGTVPPKAGLVRVAGCACDSSAGDGIEVELWQLEAQAFGQFVASLPPPTGIGKTLLADGRLVPGFICEPCAVDDAVDITRFSGWRSYIASLAP